MNAQAQCFPSPLLDPSVAISTGPVAVTRAWPVSGLRMIVAVRRGSASGLRRAGPAAARGSGTATPAAAAGCVAAGGPTPSSAASATCRPAASASPPTAASKASDSSSATRTSLVLRT